MVGMRRVILAVMATALVVCLAWMGGEAQAAGSVSLDTPGGTYTQDFNSLASSGTSSTVPTGWHFLETGNNRNSFTPRVLGPVTLVTLIVMGDRTYGPSIWRTTQW